MSAPPLPEIFGNYALKDFAEVVSPTAIDWLPQTPGWLLIAGVILYLGLKRAWRRLQFWYYNRYRGEALARLADIPLHGDQGDRVADINEVLKITALVAYPRTDVAALTGNDWTQFLNSQCDRPPFDETNCRLLAQGPYHPADCSTAKLAPLVSASAQWIQRHRGGSHV